MSATDSPYILTVAGALGVGVAVGSTLGVGASVGISVSINDIQDQDSAYINNSTVSATGHDVSLTATEGATIDAWTIGGAVGVGAGGGDAGAIGVGVGAAAPAPATPSATTWMPISRAAARSQPRTAET